MIGSVAVNVSASVMIRFGRWEKWRECEMSDVKVWVRFRRVCVMKGMREQLMQCVMVENWNGWQC